MNARFPVLGNKQFRRLWLAQIVSLTGTWMQNLSLPWLAYTLTGRPFLLGLVGAAQALPLLVLSLFAGALTDRWPRRNVLLVTQLVLMAASTLLAVLVLAGAVTYPLLVSTALLIGVANTVDISARQTLVADLVHTEQLTNAVALNAAAFNGARILGPAVAGVVMATWGLGWCFAMNALSFLPFIVILRALPKPNGRRGGVADAKIGLLRAVTDGVSYVVAERSLRRVLLLVVMMGILGFNFSVLLPVLLKQRFGLGEAAYGLLLSCLGLGSFAAATAIATSGAKRPHLGLLGLLPFGTALFFVAMSFAPWFALIAALMILIGCVNLGFFTLANAYLQLASDPAYRGRVVSVYMLAFGGMTPVGNLLAGLVVEAYSVSTCFLIFGLVLAVGVGIVHVTARLRPTPASDEAPATDET